MLRPFGSYNKLYEIIAYFFVLSTWLAKVFPDQVDKTFTDRYNKERKNEQGAISWNRLRRVSC